MLVKCFFCKSETNKIDKKDAVRIDDKNFHPECAKLYLEKKELNATICRIFNLKAPGPRNNTYISKFLKQGMTFKGMNYSLIYFYDIKKNQISKANHGIGIIPYIYEEAEKYYKYNNRKEAKRLKAAKENSNYNIRKIIINNSKDDPDQLPKYLKPIKFTDAFENIEE